MAKLFITYLFTVILAVSFVAPTYMSLVEGTCEMTEIADLGEDEENKGNETKDLDVKIYYPQNSMLTQADSKKEKRFNFYLKNYNSYEKKLTSPPPENLS